jgi:SEC-C motif-containing protein
MRSRYSAYALSLADYIIKTTHPDHPQFQQITWKWREEILSFSRSTEFIDLEILEFAPDDETAYVTFTVTLNQQDKSFSYTEKSLFEKKGGLWLYKDAEFL